MIWRYSLPKPEHPRNDMLTSISISDNVYDQYIVNAPSAATRKPLPNLSRINVFVGANNSGKSRFLRLLANSKELEFTVLIEPETKRFFDENIETLKQHFISHGLRSDDVLEKLNKLPSLNLFKERSPAFKSILDSLDQSTQVAGSRFASGAYPGGNFYSKFLEVTNATLNRIRAFINANSHSQNYDFKKIYIPTLRGLRPFGDKKTDIYQHRTQQDYFHQSPYAEIFTGLGLYDEIQTLLLGDLKSRKIVADFERFLSLHFFEGRPITLIPKLKSDVLDVKIGDEKEFPIFNLGDGIQSIIILTFPLFKYRDISVLAFFEEPELYMHPGLQRTFLNVLATEFPNHQFFLTTHSNHFLDITLDTQSVSVYTFTKEFEASDGEEKSPKFRIENVSNADVRSLELLGVRNSSVFLSNCTIWVEGITDRRYLRHYLRLYQEKIQSESGLKEFKEDLHYSFVEYGGGNITHWSFLDGNTDNIVVERLCGRLFLVCDKDSSTAKVERQNKLKECLGDRFYCLECREIENLLTPEVLQTVMRHHEGDAVEFNEVTEARYKSELLGDFIESKMLKQKPTRKGGYKTESGTIKDKVGFCNQAIEAITNYDQLSDEAKRLAERLFNFIRANNSLHPEPES